MTTNCQCNMQYISYKEIAKQKQENIIIKIKKKYNGE